MKKIIYSIVMMLAVCLTSCKKDIESSNDRAVLNVRPEDSDELKPLVSYLSKSLEVKAADIKYHAADSSFTIEGDMVVIRKYVELEMNYDKDQLKLSSVEGDRPPSQSHRKHTTVANLTSFPVIKIYNSCTSPEWRAATSQAIRNWNHPSVKAISTIRMQEVTQYAGADIVVSETGTFHPDGHVALSRLPYFYLGNRRVGEYIHIYNEGNYYALSHKEVVITHEIGHTIGFRHTGTTIILPKYWTAD